MQVNHRPVPASHHVQGITDLLYMLRQDSKGLEGRRPRLDKEKRTGEKLNAWPTRVNASIAG